MALHKKPSKEELQANIDKGLEEIEAPVETPIETPVEEKPVDKPVEEKVEEKVEEAPIEENKQEEENKVDYRKRYVESTREAQILHAKDRKINEAIEEAKKLNITDDDVSKEYPDWELMSDTEKRIARDNLLNKKRFEMLDEVTKEGKNISEWHDKVDQFTEDPKSLIDHPNLEGKIDEFKIFATKSSRRGVDFETLVSAFLYHEEQSKPKHKGSMIPTSTGGNAKPTSTKITLEQAAILRDTNYNEYKKQLRAGNIEMGVE